MGSHLNMQQQQRFTGVPVANEQLLTVGHQEPRPSVQAPQQSPPEIRCPADASQMLPQEQLGAALLAAPTALIAAHVQLRDALAAADLALRDSVALQQPTLSQGTAPAD